MDASWFPQMLRQGWREQALCAEIGGDLFFTEKKGESNNTAKRVCSMCAVRDECLAEALANREEHGVWGGLGVQERRKLLNAQDQQKAS